MTKVTNLILAIITGVALIGCAGTKDLSKAPGDIQGDWVLATINGEQVQQAQKYTLSFNTDRTVAGRSDCNYFAGEYKAQEGVVTIKPVSSTKITCSAGSQSKTYLESISSVESFEVRQGNKLVLNTAGADLVFNRVVPKEEG